MGEVLFKCIASAFTTGSFTLFWVADSLRMGESLCICKIVAKSATISDQYQRLAQSILTIGEMGITGWKTWSSFFDTRVIVIQFNKQLGCLYFLRRKIGSRGSSGPWTPDLGLNFLYSTNLETDFWWSGDSDKTEIWSSWHVLTPKFLGFLFRTEMAATQGCLEGLQILFELGV